MSPLLIIICTLYTSLSLSETFHVIIDPGHGGSDHGATKKGIREAQITLSVSKQLHQLITKNKKLSSSLIRHKDQTVALDDRVKKAHRSNADLYISIHANAHRNKKVYGPEFYFQSQLTPSKESLFLAGVENKEFSEKLRIHHWEENSWPEIQSAKGDLKNILLDMQRLQHIQKSALMAQSFYNNWQTPRRKKSSSLRQAPFYVISNANMPAVLVELGYMTNSKEFKRLKNKKFQKKLAHNILRSIESYKELLDKTQ